MESHRGPSSGLKSRTLATALGRVTLPIGVMLDLLSTYPLGERVICVKLSNKNDLPHQGR
ncbi:MAG: hypothetical protein J7L11_08655 [Thermoprotei archaeon]|nr:hypothetical protein [Thermoprotei archaeon]